MATVFLSSSLNCAQKTYSTLHEIKFSRPRLQNARIHYEPEKGNKCLFCCHCFISSRTVPSTTHSEEKGYIWTTDHTHIPSSKTSHLIYSYHYYYYTFQIIFRNSQVQKGIVLLVILQNLWLKVFLICYPLSPLCILLFIQYLLSIYYVLEKLYLAMCMPELVNCLNIPVKFLFSLSKYIKLLLRTQSIMFTQF